MLMGHRALIRFCFFFVLRYSILTITRNFHFFCFVFYIRIKINLLLVNILCKCYFIKLMFTDVSVIVCYVIFFVYINMDAIIYMHIYKVVARRDKV